MRKPVLVDAGPIVAYLDASEPDHAWAKEQFAAHPLPLLTCEPALAEAAYLIARGGSSLDTFFELVVSGSVIPRFDLHRHAPRLKAMVRQYRNVPMDLADGFGRCVFGAHGRVARRRFRPEAGFGLSHLSDRERRSGFGSHAVTAFSRQKRRTSSRK